MDIPSRSALGLALVLFCAAVSRADDKEETKKLLVGKWEIKRKLSDREVRGEREFTATGKATMKVKGPKGDVTFDGTWKLIDSRKIEITYKLMGIDMSDEYRVKVTSETLELTDKNGQTLRLTRLK
jgi:uncharacterized protein (TIGR03066 family)